MGSPQGLTAKASAAQRAEVERLAAEGLSVRRIAAAVFGDERYRGRVERILRPPLEPTVETSAGLRPIEIEGLEFGEVVRLLLERRLAMWAASGKAPAPSELSGLLDVSQRLDDLEAFEEARTLTHRRRHSTPD
jgi:hypothetical protein